MEYCAIGLYALLHMQ